MLESSVTSSVLKGGTGEWRAAKVTVTRVKLMLSFPEYLDLSNTLIAISPGAQRGLGPLLS